MSEGIGQFQSTWNLVLWQGSVENTPGNKWLQPIPNCPLLPPPCNSSVNNPINLDPPSAAAPSHRAAAQLRAQQQPSSTSTPPPPPQPSPSTPRQRPSTTADTSDDSDIEFIGSTQAPRGASRTEQTRHTSQEWQPYNSSSSALFEPATPRRELRPYTTESSGRYNPCGFGGRSEGAPRRFTSSHSLYRHPSPTAQYSS